jgi:hypothetical protein
MTTTVKKIQSWFCIVLLLVPHFVYAQTDIQENIPADSKLEILFKAEDDPGIPLRVTVIDNDIIAAKEKAREFFLSFLNSKAYASAIDEKEERKLLREDWEKLLGMDVFYPYYKAKEVEDWVSDKASVKIFKMKGSPTFKNNQFQYTFNLKF